MNAKIENISSVKKKISFELPAEKVNEEIEKAYKKIAKTAKVKGFRQGKVPQSILEKTYAPQMEEQVLGRLINDSYFKALVEHRIAAVSDPEIVESSVLEKGKPFTYEAHVEIKPEVEVKDYTGLSLQKERLDASDEVIDARLEEMRSGRAEMEVTSRKKARSGDFVTIDFEGFLDGVPFAGGKGEDYVLELGSGTFIPGFEEQVEGMKREEEKEISVTFPESYGNQDLAGKPVVFKVSVKEIKEKVLPKLDDEFAKGFGMDTLAELRDTLKDSFVAQENSRIDGDLRERLMSALIERNPVEVPESMVESQLKYMLQNISNRLQSQGMSLEMMGMNEATFKATYRDTAVQQVQGSLILEGVARQESLKVEDGEIDGKLQKIAEMSHAPLDAVKKYYASEDARHGLMGQILEEKAVEFLLGKSTIAEVDKSQLVEENKDADKE